MPVDRDIVLRFLDQLTSDQAKRWPDGKRQQRLAQQPGLPVFYRTDEDGNVAELGFCRYFRLEYKYSPYDLAWPEGEKGGTLDMAEAIFGHAGKKSLAGRVAIEPFEIKGTEYKPGGKNVVLGGPKPTCLPFYLVQKPSIKVISAGTKNVRTSMSNYNDKKSLLRGRKLYWHHDVNPEFFPQGNDNANTKSCLHPLDKGATGEFVIHVNHLTDTELGCLFEALELRDGCRHKLGMGRSLGFGSVQITIKAANIVDTSQKYHSIVERLRKPRPEPMDAAKREALRALFRGYVFEAIKTSWKDVGGHDYYSLPPIADLFLLLDYERRPAPGAVATMGLKAFGANPLLPAPRQVLNGNR